MRSRRRPARGAVARQGAIGISGREGHRRGVDARTTTGRAGALEAGVTRVRPGRAVQRSIDGSRGGGKVGATGACTFVELVIGNKTRACSPNRRKAIGGNLRWIESAIPHPHVINFAFKELAQQGASANPKLLAIGYERLGLASATALAASSRTATIHNNGDRATGLDHGHMTPSIRGNR